MCANISLHKIAPNQHKKKKKQKRIRYSKANCIQRNKLKILQKSCQENEAEGKLKMSPDWRELIATHTYIHITVFRILTQLKWNLIQVHIVVHILLAATINLIKS